jgi:hypothetical protein
MQLCAQLLDSCYLVHALIHVFACKDNKKLIDGAKSEHIFVLLQR